ncbi:hypothetical protein ABFS83_13G187100 [Erythranthe nasuta]
MDSSRNNNYGRGRGRGRGNYQNQESGGRGRGSQNHSRPPVQGNQPQQPHHASGYRPPQTTAPQLPHQPVVGVATARPNAWVRGPPSPTPTPFQAPQQPQHLGAGAGSARPNAWTQRPLGPSPPAPPRHTPSAVDLDIQKVKISEEMPVSSSSENKDNQIQPIRRPDKGGILSIRSIPLLANHFPINFNPQNTIFHYDVDVKPMSSSPNDSKLTKKKLRKSELRFIKDQLFSGEDQLKTAYDGEKSIFSAVPLREGQFQVDISQGEDVRSGSYTFVIKLVNELKLSKLRDYLRGNLSYVPRDILQGMDLVMKENPSRKRIAVGRSFFSPDFRSRDDFRNGLAAYRGLQQSLKPTLQGLALCLDYSVLAFRKPWPVMEFLKEHFKGFQVQDVKKSRRAVNDALRGLKVTVTHRRTKQKYTVAGLSEEDTCDIYFDLVDMEGKNPPQRTSLVKYFKEKWGKDIVYQNIPCLELGKGSKSNKVPMEFCVLVEGQRYPKENLDRNTAVLLKNISLADPGERRDTINEMVRSDDGPCGDVARNFGFQLDRNMTKVSGRVIGSPDLKLGAPRPVKVDAVKCQWNLLGKSFVDAKPIERWALLDLTGGDRYKLQEHIFISNLIGRCRSLGNRIEEPVVYRLARMSDLSSVNRVEKLLKGIMEESNRISEGKLQLIVCVMTKKDPGYKNLKWVSETKLGVVTQCCLSGSASKPQGQDQYFANLCLKINAKLGGNNFEVAGKFTHFDARDHVMFIGADVNHPAPMNSSCPSIAAVVATVNWPAANKYAARVSPQKHRCEKIENFGAMCLDLVNTYAKFNKVKPKGIVVFRDGVSEGQFEMVLSQELLDLKNSIYDGDYQPSITLVVAQKRHQTRLFIDNGNSGGRIGNVPPGTVVDTRIVHPLDFDFYLCSHYGALGTSKPTHYYVLWDENSFTSDQLQKLINDMCYTFVRCTKPVSLVPPVYYADLVAYRGRMFQEVAMENQYDSSNAAFDQSFYSLHPDLENFMFFV